MHLEVIVLRLIHILTGIFWVGSAQLETARRRGATAGTVTGVLLVLAAAGMATGRYLR